MTDHHLASLFMDLIPRSMRLVRTEMRGVAIGQMTISQFRIMAQLYQHSNTNRELAEHNGVAVATMSRNVDVLVKRGWVTRSTSSVDRREISVKMSEQGRTEFQKIRKSAQSKFANQIARLSDQQREDLVRGFVALESLVELG